MPSSCCDKLFQRTIIVFVSGCADVGVASYRGFRCCCSGDLCPVLAKVLEEAGRHLVAEEHRIADEAVKITMAPYALWGGCSVRITFALIVADRRSLACWSLTCDAHLRVVRSIPWAASLPRLQ